jgi:hypothetical protein
MCVQNLTLMETDACFPKLNYRHHHYFSRRGYRQSTTGESIGPKRFIQTLGIHKTISGNQNDQIASMKKKSDDYARNPFGQRHFEVDGPLPSGSDN